MRERHRQRVLAVDVCGTLYDENTTAGFCLHHHTRLGNRALSVILSVLNRPRSVLSVLLGVIDRLVSVDLHRKIIILSLKGESRLSLEASAVTYVDYLPSRRIEVVHNLLSELRPQHCETILISNGLNIVVAEIARRLEVAYIASDLSFSQGRCLGLLHTDLCGRKFAALVARMGCGIRKDNLTIITDNKSDADIIVQASHVYIVQNGKKRKWMEAHDAHFLKL